jgi:hypothetical protein
MATVADEITYARQLAQTDSNGITDTTGLAWANNGLIDITRDLINRGIDAAQTQEAYTTLTAPTGGTTSTFAWPTGMFALKTVEVDYTGAGGQAFIQATKLDVANLQGNTSWDFVRQNQRTDDPQFTNHGDTGEIFPTVQGGSCLIKIYYYLQPTPYATTASTINYPQTLDVTCLGDRILTYYYRSLEKFDIAQQWEASYAKKIGDAINILAPQSKQPINPTPLQITGWQY